MHYRALIDPLWSFMFPDFVQLVTALCVWLVFCTHMWKVGVSHLSVRARLSSPLDGLGTD